MRFLHINTKHSAYGETEWDEPSTMPYASGHGPRVSVLSAAVTDGHVPSLYIELKIWGPNIG